MKLKFDYLTKCLLLFVIAVGMSSLATAQRTVTGIATDAETGDPLIGANILVLGTSTGTVTDIDGSYSLEVPEGFTELEFTYTGYAAQRVTIGADNVVNVALSSGEVLDEIVVIGYGTVKKDDATGAVASLGEEDFNKGFYTSPEQLIQGQVAGVQVTGSTGEPGAGSSIRIRGTGSIRSGNNALIVLDGVPLDGRDISAGADVGAGRQASRNPLNFLNPNDIESINVLKDASATAIYGSRGANGVIIITTKKGRSGKPQLSLSASNTISFMPGNRKYDLLDASTFISETNNPNLNLGDDVNAFDEILRTANTQDVNLTYGGSNDNGGDYRVSLGLQNQEGIIKNTGLEKYSGTFNITQKALNDRLTLSGRLIASYVKDEAAALSENVGAEGDMMISALRWNPTRPFRNPDGTFNQPSDNERNPLAFLDMYSDETETSRIFGNISATFNIIDGLNYKFNYGIDRSESNRRAAISRAFLANFAEGSGGVGNIESIRASTQLFEHTLDYTTDLNSNINLNALVGYSYQEFLRRGSNQRGNNFLVDDQNLYVNNLNFAGSFPQANNSSFTDPNDELQSYFGRVNLDIQNKILVTATVRADGSSRFGEDNRYGVFPSAAIAYKLEEEDFLPETFNQLKVRVGWGITGNQEFPSGSAQNQFKPLDDGSGIQREIVGNPALQWEETTQINAGVDFAFLDYRLTGSIDWYTRETENLLFRLRAAQPAPDVFIWRNLDGVTVENTGIDFALNATFIDKPDMTFDMGLNVSYFDNQINNVSSLFPDGIITGEINGQGLSDQRAQLLYDGQPLYTFYLPFFEGFDDNGNGVYTDLNGDGEDTSSGIVAPGAGDRGFTGDPNPDVTVGLRSGFRYKDLDVSMYWYGAFGHQVFDNTALALFNRAALVGGANVDERVLSSGQGGSDSPKPSTLFLEDADFLRLANLTVGYNLRVKSEYLENIRLYVTGQNLLLITGYNGFDPEVNVNKNVDEVPSFGIDYATYPRATSIVLGANLTF